MSEPKKAFPWKKALLFALFAVLVVLLGWYLWEHRADMAKLLSLSATDVALLLGLAFAGCALNCVYHKIILNTYDIPLTLTDWAGVVCVSNALAYVMPLRGDLVFTGVYYKRVKGLQYTKSLSMLGGNIVFGVGFALLQMGVALVLTGVLDGSWPVVLWAAWGACAVALVALVVFSLVFGKQQNKLMQKYKLLGDVVTGFNALLKNKRMLWQVLACLIANNVVKLLLHMVCFRAIGVPISFYQAMFFAGVSWLAGIFSIVPGNLGIKEGLWRYRCSSARRS